MGRKIAIRLRHRRRREGKTDFRLRLALIKSRRLRFVARKSLNNMTCSFVQHKIEGDAALVTADSKELKAYGWKVNAGNLPASYLTGFLAGIRAKQAGIKEAVFDMGLARATKGNRLFAALKGAIDSGLEISYKDVVLPESDRISGRHIASYAEHIKRKDSGLYTSMFSSYLKNAIQPESLPEHFETAKKHIIETGASKSRKGVAKAEAKKTGKKQAEQKPEAAKKAGKTAHRMMEKKGAENQK